MFAIAGAFMRFVDEALAKSEDGDTGESAAWPSGQDSTDQGQAQPQAALRVEQYPSLLPSSSSTPLDAFNTQVERIHLATAERRYHAARLAWHIVDTMAARLSSLPIQTGQSSATPASGTTSLASCPHCGRRVASVPLHIKTCPAASRRAGVALSTSIPPDANGGQSPAAAAPHPLREMSLHLKSRLCDSIVSALSDPTFPSHAMRDLWVDGSSLGDLRATQLFSGQVVSHFRNFASEAVQAMESIRAINRVALGLAGGGGTNIGGNIGSGPGRPVASSAYSGAGSGLASPPPQSAAAAPRGGRSRMAITQQLAQGNAQGREEGMFRVGGPAAPVTPGSSSATNQRPTNGSGSGDGNEVFASGLHLYLRRHRSALGPPSAQIDRYGMPVPSPDDGDAAGGGGGNDAPFGASQSQPHVDALTRLLGEASAWMIAVMEANASSSASDGGGERDPEEQELLEAAFAAGLTELPGVPHAHRVAVAEALHAACVSACLPVLRSYVEDTMLHATLGVARALLAHAERGAGRGGERGHGDDEDDGNGDGGHDGSASYSGNNGGTVSTGRQHHPASILRVEVQVNRHPPPAPSPHPAPRDPSAPPSLPAYSPLAVPLPWPTPLGPPPHPALLIHADAARSIVDEAADQLSFLCQALERYLRCVTVCTARSSSGSAPSAMPPGDPLLAAMQELQGAYVLLEHAYVVHAVRGALAPSPQPGSPGDGWRPVAVTEDTRCLSFGWADHALFLAHKALSRAAGTCCEMAACAVVNYVTGAVDGDVTGALRECVRLAGDRRGGGNSCDDGGEATGLAEGDQDEQEGGADSAMFAQLTSALLGGSGGEGAQPAASVLDDASFGAGLPHREPRPSDHALHALNTLVTATGYLAALAQRATAEMASVFPAVYDAQETPLPPLPPPAPSSGSASPTSRAHRAAAESEASSAVHAHLAAAVQPSLVGPLSELHRLSRSLASHLPEAGAGFMAASVSAPACRTLASALRRCSYVVSSDSEYDARAALSGNPVVQAVAVRLVLQGVLGPTLGALTKPSAAELLLRHVAQRVAHTLECGWLGAPLTGPAVTNAGGDSSSHGPPVNEVGALLMSAEAREVQALLAAHSANTGGHGSGVRAAFRPLSQALGVLAIESLRDLYSLPAAGFTAALTRGQVLGLLQQRSGAGAANLGSGFLTVSAASLGAIEWDRVVISRSA